MDTILIGVLATALFDVWLAFVQPRIFGSPFNGFPSFGRWVGNFPKGRFIYDDFAKAAPVAHENLIGWIFHYAVGILFTGILVFVWGTDWLAAPNLTPALIVGIGSVVAPLCIIQPAYGLGFFASKTPKPRQAQMRSLVGHTVFGFCLYAAGLVVATWLA